MNGSNEVTTFYIGSFNIGEFGIKKVGIACAPPTLQIRIMNIAITF